MIQDRNLKCNISEQIFKKYSDKIYIYLKKTHTKGSNYDPYRDIGYATVNSSPIFVKGIIRQINSNTKLAKEIGHIISGSIDVLIKDKDVSLIKNAEKIKYNNNEYSIYNDALGNRVQIQDSGFGFHSVILFRKGA
ncbi:MAG: hypothetical protein ACTSWG_10445 [Candidatus Helarchaeota archaeon]